MANAAPNYLAVHPTRRFLSRRAVLRGTLLGGGLFTLPLRGGPLYSRLNGLPGRRARAARRASAGTWNTARDSDTISESGVVPRASTVVRSPVRVSSTAPRAMVREPSERISTMSRATTGGSSSRAGTRGGAGVGSVTG